jgi:ubiquinone/menaquinone biosynthesis C-methylase UbiE
MSHNSTLDYFEKHAGTYDDFQRATVPRYDEMLTTIAEACHHYTGGDGVFLDQGCGTGNLTLAIISRSPKLRAHLLDGSTAMMEQALGKIEAAGLTRSILGSHIAQLETTGWHRTYSSSFDAIVTAFVLEHLNERAYKAAIQANLALLKPGGAFITLEWSDDAHGMQRWFMDEMQSRCDALANYRPIVEDGKKMEQHYFVTIEEKMRWIREAGFTNVHTVWQYLFGFLVVAERAR